MRYTETEIEDIKQNNRLEILLPSFGFALHKHGNDLKTLCPFHDDKNPSLIITPEKNLWHCMACNEGGSVIDFYMKYKNLSFLAAVEQLKEKKSVSFTGIEVKKPSKKNIPRAKLLERVTAFYQKAFKDDPRGLEYFESRGIKDHSIFENFRIGFCNGTLYKVIPEKGDIVENLKEIGILQENGRESFENCVVFPLFNDSGTVVSLYGRKIENESPLKHLYLSGPRNGLFNGHALRSFPEIILTESVIDSLSLYQAGIKNTVPCYGVNGFTPYHLEQLKAAKTKKAVILFDNDDTGREGALNLKKQLQEQLIACEIRELSECKDANEYLIRYGAEKLYSFLAENLQLNEKNSALSVTSSVNDESGCLFLDYHGRKYHIRGIESSVSRLKANIKAENCTRFHIDTFDLYSAKSRRSFIRESALLFKEDELTIEGDILNLIGSVEQFSKDRGTEQQTVKSGMTDRERNEALNFGKSPDLIEKILKDIENLGFIGERNNKILSYIAMTSRKTNNPLSVMILSASGAGKSALQDTILMLCPDEDLIKLTSLTERALFYKDSNSLQNKVLALAEEAGGEEAGYAIRNLISSRELTIEATVKDPVSGRMTTMTNTVKGPTAVFKTTTNPETDAETRSRFIILAVDESIEQTRRILTFQREQQTFEGFIQYQKRGSIIRKHNNFQRLLRNVAVFNPYARLLTYEDRKLWVRRDNPKYLQLINAITFLHQLQRPLKRKNGIDYIEVTLDDIALANELAGEIFCRSLDDLSSPARKLLKAIESLVSGRDPATFTRRELREYCGWGETYVRKILVELARMDCILVVRGVFGCKFQYEFLRGNENESAGFMNGLLSMEALKQKAVKLGIMV